MSESEYRKMEKELREFCGGSIIIPDGQEDKFRSKNRIQVLRVRKKEKKEKIQKMGGISRIRRVIQAIFSEEDHKQDN